MNVSKIISERDTKRCICISTGNGKYLFINSHHRDKYDDFKIESSEYSFLNHDSYVGCSEIIMLKDEHIIKKVGNLKYDDMRKILNKIKNSKFIVEAERDVIAVELEEWLNNYRENKLNDIFKNR